jgi:hypothetical protein
MREISCPSRDKMAMAGEEMYTALDWLRKEHYLFYIAE